MNQADPLLLVQEFTKAFRLDWKEQPGVPTDQTALLRVQLPTEELGELVHALAAQDKIEVVDALTDIDYVTYGAMGAFGLYALPVGFAAPTVPEREWGQTPAWEQLVLVHEISKQLNLCTMAFSMILHPDQSVRAKGQDGAFLALQLVLKATANAWAALGVLKYREAAFYEVQRSNMSKLGPNGEPILNEAGRVTKGPNYLPPDIDQIIMEVDSYGDA